MTRILRDEIMLGKRLPGARLVERDLAAELNVSRLPVREAIRALVAEGIVVTRPRTWATVREFTLRDIEDFGEVREAIETLIFVFAAQRHDEAGLGRLRDALEREQAAAAIDDADTARAAAADFHEIATELANNEMLGELISVFITRLRWLFGQHDDLQSMVQEHRVLYEALAARDVERLRVLVPQHLASGREAAEKRLIERTASAIDPTTPAPGPQADAAPTPSEAAAGSVQSETVAVQSETVAVQSEPADLAADPASADAVSAPAST